MKSIFLKLWVWVTGASVELFKFLEPILRNNGAALLDKLRPIALEVVASYMDSKLTGDEKRAAATKDIKEAAIRQGVELGTDVAQTLIQIALLNLRAGGSK